MSNERKSDDFQSTPYELSATAGLGEVIRQVIPRLEPQVAELITPELAKSINKVYFTGCGDSHYAGVAARLAFDKHSGVQTEPLESLEFSRYVVDYMPQGSLLFGISNSGQVSRSTESIVLARQRGAKTIAITGNKEGPLAKAAEAVLIQTVPEMAGQRTGRRYGSGSLGLGNFLASLLALYLSGLRIGELRGKLQAKEAAALKEELLQTADILTRTAEHNSQPAYDLACALWHLDTFFILGGGPNYATAMFAAAKLFEQPHQTGVAQELEEWAHEQYFLTRPNVSPIFVIAPPGNSRDRAIEQIHGARDFGGTVIAICDSEDQEIQKLAHWSLPVQGKMREEFTPLAYTIPGMLFATALHQVKGRPPMIPPYDHKTMREVNYRQIFHSAIRER